MAEIVERGAGWHILDDGRIQASEKVARALAVLEGEDDDDDDSVQGDDDDDNEVGADKKKKKKGLLSKLFGKKSDKTSAKTTTVTVNGGMPHQMALKKSPFKPAFLSAAETTTGAGVITLTIRPQEDFHAGSVHFDGSLASSGVIEIKFGAKSVYSGSAIDIDIFKASNPLGDMLKNTFVKAGLDIIIKMELPGAGTGKVFIRGQSPRNDDNC